MNERSHSIFLPEYLLNLFDKTEEGKAYTLYKLGKLCGNLMWLKRNMWIIDRLVKRRAMKMNGSHYIVVDKGKMFDVFKEILIRYAKSYKSMEFFLKGGIVLTKEGVIIDI